MRVACLHATDARAQLVDGARELCRTGGTREYAQAIATATDEAYETDAGLTSTPPGPPLAASGQHLQESQADAMQLSTGIRRFSGTLHFSQSASRKILYLHAEVRTKRFHDSLCLFGTDVVVIVAFIF